MPQPRTYQKTILEPSNYQTIFTKQKPKDARHLRKAFLL